MRVFRVWWAVVLTVITATAAVPGLGAAAGGVLIPQGEVAFVTLDGKATQSVTSVVPLPRNQAMLCKGQCLMQASGFQVVAQDKAVLAVSESRGRWEVNVKAGRVDFAVQPEPGFVTFVTPHETFHLEEVIAQASAASDSLVRGTLSVTGDASELTIHSGGIVQVRTSSGLQSVAPGRSIQLAQSQMVPTPSGVLGGQAAGGGATAAGTGGTSGVVTDTGAGTAAAGAGGLGSMALLGGSAGVLGVFGGAAFIASTGIGGEADEDISPSVPR